MGIKVLKGGLLSTIQDLGRFGYQKDGIVVSGAMDLLALRIGNLLVGNAESEAGLEITLLGPSLFFEADQRIAITGADLSPAIDGMPVGMWRPLRIAKGSTLSFGKPIDGCRSYLAVSGGFDIPLVLNSYATYLNGKFGGHEGRALKTGDTLSFKRNNQPSSGKINWKADLKLYPDLKTRAIRVIEGPEINLFSEESIAAFFTSEFRISTAADRMGYRLEGQQLKWTASQDLLSSAVTFGTIQVPAQGDPIILMADHQTTGGYPRIAQVISCDLTLLAQMRPGDVFKFELITLARAHELLILREQQLKQLKQTIAFKYE
ncbi:5-oxoprolinase subunit C family protein [Pedobacter metabolipauper]|uniref:Antagonist of KipI n=1 Tax=Pedobacter metabolipauper TaxID=425513 RepID=A0A4R6SY83_9SPHI|nr:biotin-dependent carboxyltransferase family protein [Pedobacter metabolipauper]TDQ11366.1 antagonist of KipI [Pedobacter metabolipauper]